MADVLLAPGALSPQQDRTGPPAPAQSAFYNASSAQPSPSAAVRPTACRLGENSRFFSVFFSFDRPRPHREQDAAGGRPTHTDDRTEAKVRFRSSGQGVRRPDRGAQSWRRERQRLLQVGRSPGLHAAPRGDHRGAAQEMREARDALSRETTARMVAEQQLLVREEQVLAPRCAGPRRRSRAPPPCMQATALSAQQENDIQQMLALHAKVRRGPARPSARNDLPPAQLQAQQKLVAELRERNAAQLQQQQKLLGVLKPLEAELQRQRVAHATEREQRERHEAALQRQVGATRAAPAWPPDHHGDRWAAGPAHR
jgi:hypothetical protein